jgi:hypothetical protein
VHGGGTHDDREMAVPTTLATVKVSSIRFDEAVYPRAATDPALVQRYAEYIEQIEAAGAYNPRRRRSSNHDRRAPEGS